MRFWRALGWIALEIRGSMVFCFKRGTEGGLLGLVNLSCLIQFMVFGQLSKHPVSVCLSVCLGFRV